MRSSTTSTKCFGTQAFTIFFIDLAKAAPRVCFKRSQKISLTQIFEILTWNHKEKFERKIFRWKLWVETHVNPEYPNKDTDNI